MSSKIIVRGYGTFGSAGCLPTRGYSCSTTTRSLECITAVKSGSIKNNRITVFNGTAYHKDNGQNQVASAASISAELGERFDDPRYYGRVL